MVFNLSGWWKPWCSTGSYWIYSVRREHRLALSYPWWARRKRQKKWIYSLFSPPARWGLLDFIRVVLLLLLLLLLLLVLLHRLCLHFHVHFRLANSSPSSSPTSARSGHCWTSTARVWAHWAPLDLNLGPPELSEHRWTSTWDPPSSVRTAGPQPGTSTAR